MAPPTLQKTYGWSAFTQQQQQTPHRLPGFFPQFASHPCCFLASPCDSELRTCSTQACGEGNDGAPTFAEVVKESGPGEDSQPRPLSVVVSRLRAVHSWADEALVEDVLRARDLDEESASAYLFSMTMENSSRIETSADKESTASSVDNEACSALSVQVSQVNSSQLSVESLCIEPEWKQEDIYYATRRDALKMSRAREKHSLGAYTAFMNGDYSRAKSLSRKAKEEGAEAKRLHAEAAKQIFLAQNLDAHRNVWELDFHGLHVGEATAALQQRLRYIETQLSKRQEASASNSSNLLKRDCESTSSSVAQSFVSIHPYYQESNCEARVFRPFRQGLKVITGVGNHSRGGGSLSGAVKGFLLQNGYKFEEPRSGMIVVYPKFHLVDK